MFEKKVTSPKSTENEATDIAAFKTAEAVQASLIGEPETPESKFDNAPEKESVGKIKTKQGEIKTGWSLSSEKIPEAHDLLDTLSLKLEG